MTLDTRQLQNDGATITYDVDGPLPTADGRPPLVMIGQPMEAVGFRTLQTHFPERTVVTYDPRGMGRSTRQDGVLTQTPQQQAGDVHAVIEAIGGGPVEMLASSGGAVTALELVRQHPDDVSTLVAHEPPIISVLPDAEKTRAAQQAFYDTYQAKGPNAGMAHFIAMTSWPGEFTDEYLARPAPDPAAFGMPDEDNGSRDDPLLSGVADAITAYRLDVDALRAAPTRIVLAAGEESRDMMPGRGAAGAADALGLPLTVFPSHHGGFMGGEFGYAGQPEAFAARLHEVLDEGAS